MLKFEKGQSVVFTESHKEFSPLLAKHEGEEGVVLDTLVKDKDICQCFVKFNKLPGEREEPIWWISTKRLNVA